MFDWKKASNQYFPGSGIKIICRGVPFAIRPGYNPGFSLSIWARAFDVCPQAKILPTFRIQLNSGIVIDYVFIIVVAQQSYPVQLIYLRPHRAPLKPISEDKDFMWLISGTSRNQITGAIFFTMHL
jgi:hypothetical protein